MFVPLTKLFLELDFEKPLRVKRRKIDYLLDMEGSPCSVASQTSG